MLAEQIEALHTPGAYVAGKTVKEMLKSGDLQLKTTEGHPILDAEMYFVNEHGIWLVE